MPTSRTVCIHGCSGVLRNLFFLFAALKPAFGFHLNGSDDVFRLIVGDGNLLSLSRYLVVASVAVDDVERLGKFQNVLALRAEISRTLDVHK